MPAFFVVSDHLFFGQFLKFYQIVDIQCNFFDELLHFFFISVIFEVLVECLDFANSPSVNVFVSIVEKVLHMDFQTLVRAEHLITQLPTHSQTICYHFAYYPILSAFRLKSRKNS